MTKQPRVSIIVPIYNVEKYLRRCLDSIIGQTLKDIEIIIINDGSTDNSLAIMKEYEANDKRIVIVDKKNEGYGKTVNLGLDIAGGEYIGIIESDDWAELDMFEKLYNVAKKYDVDIVKSAYYAYSNKQNEYVRRSIPHQDSNRIVCPLKENDIFLCGQQVWSFVYKKDFLNENKIRFLETPGASYQDLSFNFKVLALAKTAYFLRDAFVHYRIDSEGSSINSQGKNFCVCDEFKEVEKFLNSHPVIKSKIKTMANRYKYGSYSWNYHKLSGKARKLFAQRISKELQNELRNGKFDKRLYNTKDYNQYLYFANYERTFYRICYHTKKFLAKLFFYITVSNGTKRVFIFGVRVYKRKKNKLKENLDYDLKNICHCACI